MNYRHQFHAGNFADVAKHVLLVALLRALQQKPKGYLYLDTHAGRGAYDLATAARGDSLERTPEWPDGIGRLWSRTDVPEPVADYVSLVRAYDRQRGNLAAEPRYYPGSPLIAAAVARSEDRMTWCELHPAEIGGLRTAAQALRRDGPRVSVQAVDGYVAVRSMLPPPERRALVLVDPPYEAQDEFARATTALADGLARFPSGVFALWYPLTERARVQEFLTAVERLQPPPTLIAELTIAPEHSVRKLKGCGLLIINPPWRFEAAATTALGFLAPVLAQERGGGGRVTWLVPEE